MKLKGNWLFIFVAVALVFNVVWAGASQPTGEQVNKAEALTTEQLDDFGEGEATPPLGTALRSGVTRSQTDSKINVIVTSVRSQTTGMTADLEDADRPAVGGASEIIADDNLSKTYDVPNTGSRTATVLTFEDDSDLLNWSHHDEANAWTTEAWDSTGGVDSSGALHFTDGGFTFLVKRLVTTTVGQDYRLTIDVNVDVWGTGDLGLSVQGLSTTDPAVVVSGYTGYNTFTLTGTADLNDSGYVRIHSTGSTTAPSVYIDNMIFESDAPTDGGPDTYGYTWASNFDAAGPTYGWIDTTGATNSGIANGDDYRGTIDLPFPFYFYGNWFNQAVATTNGWLGMGTNFTSSYYSNYTIPTSGSPNNLIAPLWDDFKAGGTYPAGAIYYKTVGTAPNRQFVVIFHEFVRSSSNTDFYTFEVILEETTNNIIFQYADVVGSSSSANYGVGATVGIENGAGDDGLLIGYNGAPQQVYDGMAIEFTFPSAAFPTTPEFVALDTELDFGLTGTAGVTGEARIQNNGGVDLNVSGISFTNTDFSSLSTTLAVTPGAESGIDVNYTPTAVAGDTAWMIIAHDGTTSPDSIKLLGAGADALFWQDFEAWAASGGYSDPDPIGWSQTIDAGQGGSDGKGWEKETSTYSFVYLGSYASEFDGYETTGNGSFITPEISFVTASSPDVTMASLEFYLKKRGTHQFDVDYTIDAGATWVNGYTTTMANYESGSGGWALVQIMVPVGEVYQFRFVGLGDGSSTTSDVYIDEVSMVEVPPVPVLSLAYDELALLPSIIGEAAQELAFIIGANSGAGTLGIDSIVTTNSDFSVAVTAAVRTDSVAAGGDVVVDLSFTATAFGDAMSQVIFYTNATSSPDTMKLTGEASRYYVDFQDWMFPYGWTIIDNDGINGYGYDDGWILYTSYGPGYDVPYARSHFNVDGANDWMITQKLSPVTGDSLIFRTNSSSGSILEDTLHIYVSTTDNAMASFTTQIGEVLSEGYTNLRPAFDLSAYNGQDIYLAIVHHGSVGSNYWSYRKVDDIMLPARYESANPELAVVPDTLDFGWVLPGTTETDSVWIYNAGGVDLVISDISADNAAYTVGATSATLAAFESMWVDVVFAPTASGAYDATLTITSNAATSPDAVALLGEGSPSSGGPGSGGYTWINSFDVAGPTYSWIDTSGATAHSPNALGDDWRQDVDLPFTFFYYGNLVSTAVMTTNGWVGFDPSYTSSYWTNYSIPNTGNPNNMAAPLWDDFKAASASSYHGILYTKTVGTAPDRQFAFIFWELVRNSSDTDWYSFEMIIEEGTNNIIFQYYDVDGSGNTGTDASNGIGATVGLEGPDGDIGLEYLYNGDPLLVYDGEAIEFIAPPLPPMGAVEGIVTDMVGAPIAGAAVELYSVDDVLIQMDSTDAAGAYFMEYLSPGLVDLYAFADGFRPSEYIVNIVAGDTIIQDVVLAADTAGVSLVWYTGFETTDDSGSVGIFTGGGTNTFAVVDSFVAGIETILPATGSQMLTFPDPDSATAYDNDNYAYWMASDAIGLAGRDEGSLYFEVDANYDTEDGWDYFYLAVLLDDGYFYIVSELTGYSDGWVVEGADISWVFDSGSTYFVPMIVFESDGSIVDGWGGAFDNARILYDEYFLAPVVDLATTNFLSDVTLTWSAPAARGTVDYDLQRVDLEDPHVYANSDGVTALAKGPSPKEKVTMSYGYSNDVSRDLLGYKVFKVDGPLGDEEDAELLAVITATTFNDAAVVDGNYYGYGVSVSYDEGDSYVEGVWTRVGAVTQVAPFGETFEGLSGALPTGWEAFTNNPDGISWTVGDSAAASDSAFIIVGKCPAHTDFAFVEDGGGNDYTFEALLISPFIDASDMYSAVVEFAGYEQGWGDTPGNTTITELWVRAEMGDWELVTDFSYDHNAGWVDYMGDVAGVVGGMEYVQFAFYYFHLGGYNSGGGNGIAVDDFDFFGLAGPANLTAAGAQGHVELNWSEPSARSRELISGNVVAQQITMDRTETGLVPGPVYDNRDACFANWLPAGWFTGFYGPDSGYTAPTIATLFEFPNGPMTLEMALHHGIWYNADAPFPDTVRAYITVSETDLAGVTQTIIAADTAFYYLESGYYYDVMLDLVGLTYDQTDTSYLKVAVELLDDAYYSNFDANVWMPPLRIDDPNDDLNSGLSGYDSAGIFLQDDGYDWFLEICGTPTPPALRYNVFRDDLLLNDEPLEEVTYLDEDVLVLEEHDYFVTGFVPIVPASDNPGEMLFVDTDSSNHAMAAALNTPPSAPSLAVPPDNFTVAVNDLTGAASFAWAPSVETDIGQSVTYDFVLTLGTYTWEISTDVTTVAIPHQELYTEIFDNQGAQSLTGAWNVVATDGLDDTPASNGPRNITVDVTAVGVVEDPAIPDVFALHQNYPNPFNPTTTIAYDIPEASQVRIDIYNLLGQKIRTLVNGEHAPAYYHARWDGTTDAGAIVASGMYIYRIDAGKFSAIHKMVIMK